MTRYDTARQNTTRRHDTTQDTARQNTKRHDTTRHEKEDAKGIMYLYCCCCGKVVLQGSAVRIRTSLTSWDRTSSLRSFPSKKALVMLGPKAMPTPRLDGLRPSNGCGSDHIKSDMIPLSGGSRPLRYAISWISIVLVKILLFCNKIVVICNSSLVFLST